MLSEMLRCLQLIQVGPAVVRSFHDFLVRLQLQCLDYERLKEICLRLVNTLASEG